jgi:hypothetical protein
MMKPVIDYAGRHIIRPSKAGVGYFALVALNSIALLLGIGLFFVGISGDAYAPMLGVIFGIPLLFGQVLLAGLPAWIYLSRNDIVLPKASQALLLTLSIAPGVIGLSGIVLSFALPRTHGSGC